MDLSSDLFVCHIAAFDGRGGAGQAMAQIHDGLVSMGVNSHILCLRTHRASEKIQTVSRSSSFARRMKYLLFENWNKGFKNKQLHPGMFEIFTDISSPYENLWNLVPPDTSIVQLNWVSFLLDWKSFFVGSRTLPLVWRLADTNPFTGGCHYPGHCQQFQYGCDHCPQLSSKKYRERVRENFKEKQRLLTAMPTNRLFLVAQSNWMAKQIRTSPIFSRFPLVVIRNGVDRSLFGEQTSKFEARKQLGVPRDAVVALVFGSASFPRKGTEKLIDHLSKISHRRLHLMIVGDTASQTVESGQITKISAMPKWLLPPVYSAADFLIFPSLQDNCPNTVLEAHACGLPVLCFNNSGTAELIDENKNGWLVPDGDFEALADKVLTLVNNEAFPSRQVVSSGIKSSVEMVNDYFLLYKKVLSMT